MEITTIEFHRIVFKYGLRIWIILAVFVYLMTFGLELAYTRDLPVEGLIGGKITRLSTELLSQGVEVDHSNNVIYVLTDKYKHSGSFKRL